MMAGAPQGRNARAALGQAPEVRVPKRSHHGRSAAAAGSGASRREMRRATRWRSSEIFYFGNLVMTGFPSLAAMTAFGPAETMVAEIGSPSDRAMSASLMP